MISTRSKYGAAIAAKRSESTAPSEKFEAIRTPVFLPASSTLPRCCELRPVVPMTSPTLLVAHQSAEMATLSGLENSITTSIVDGSMSEIFEKNVAPKRSRGVATSTKAVILKSPRSPRPAAIACPMRPAPPIIASDFITKP